MNKEQFCFNCEKISIREGGNTKDIKTKMLQTFGFSAEEMRY